MERLSRFEFNLNQMSLAKFSWNELFTLVSKKRTWSAMNCSLYEWNHESESTGPGEAHVVTHFEQKAVGQGTFMKNF